MIGEHMLIKAMAGLADNYRPIFFTVQHWPTPKGPTGIAKARRAAKKRRNAAKRGAA